MVNRSLPQDERKKRNQKLSDRRRGWLVPLLVYTFVASNVVFTSRDASAGPSATTIPLSGERVARASLAVADFNGDGYKEIVAAGQEGMLYVVAYNGPTWSVVWERQTAIDLNAAGAPNPTSTTEIQSTPAVADLDGDGRPEIVVTIGGDPGHHKNGGVLVYTCNSAWPWTFSVADGWPQPKLDIVGTGETTGLPDGYWDGIWGSPALGDLDGDGDLEIAVEGFDRRLHAWHHDGTVVDGWPITQDNGDALLRGGWSSPAVGDIDNDGLPEVVFGTDSPEWEGEGTKPDYSKATVWAINGDSSVVPGFPVSTDQTIQSSPALGDIDGDGVLEIVVGTGEGISGTGGHKVYAWNSDGSPVPGWPQLTLTNMPAPPALGDLDGDGDLEVVMGCGNGSANCKYLYAWHGDGSPVSGFPMRPVGFNFWTDELYHDPVYSPVLADYDGDGQVEIMTVLAGSWGITIVESNGATNPDQSRETSADLMAAPVVDDIDNDGALETLIGGADSSGTHGEITIWDEAGTTGDALPWPTFHHDMRLTGNVWGADLTPPTDPTLSPFGHALSTWSNDNTVQVDLSGATDDESGVRRYYYAWDASPGTALDRSAAYVDATTTSITSDPLADGNTHYFHLRALDRAGNLAADTEHLGPFWIDTKPPTSAASSLPFAAGSVLVSWQGSDVGPSGLDSYNVQLREGVDGTWTTWLDEVTVTQAAYTGTVGNTYFFRSIARDAAGNVETPPEEGDTGTTITAYGFMGQVLNNREEPIFGAQVQMQPEPTVLGVLPSDWTGAYGLFFNDDGTYQLTVRRNGLGTLPPKYVHSGRVSGLDFYLPPADDFISDGNFELGSGTLDASAWEIRGTTVPTLTEMAHTGLQALLMQGPGTAVVSQTLTLPDGLDADALTLSWMASVTGTIAARDVLTIEAEVDGLTHVSAVSLMDMSVGDWTHGYLPVDVQSSQVVIVRLMLEATSKTLVCLDEISLGETQSGVKHVHLPILSRNSQD